MSEIEGQAVFAIIAVVLTSGVVLNWLRRLIKPAPSSAADIALFSAVVGVVVAIVALIFANPLDRSFASGVFAFVATLAISILGKKGVIL